MQVITLNPEDLDVHAARLAKAVAEGNDTRYDAIVAVRRGGSFICDAFLRHFPERRYEARYDLTLQRPSTRHKEGRLKGLIKGVMKALPYPLLDVMRMAESEMLELRRMPKASAETSVEIPEGLAQRLSNEERPEILVIDDAIDSGDTLTAIVETLRKTNPNARISIAVMTETTRHPRIRSNYSLYRNRTLIRFPWSTDYKSH